MITNKKFKTIEELKILLSKKFMDDNFDNIFFKPLFAGKTLKIWFTHTNTKLWFILDNGNRRKVYPIDKGELNYTLTGEYYNDYFKMYSNQIPVNLILDNDLCGGTEVFKKFLDSVNVKKEHVGLPKELSNQAYHNAKNMTYEEFVCWWDEIKVK